MAGIDSDLIRGHIDTIILKSLFEGDKYGLEIIQEIEEKSNGSYELKQPTLYSCLKRLETQGLISSYWEDSEIGGRRHYYTLTDLGKQEYQNNQQEWLRSKEIIDNLIYNDSANKQNEELPIVDQLEDFDGSECEENATATPSENEMNEIDEDSSSTILNNESVDSANENDSESLFVASENQEDVESQLNDDAVDNFATENANQFEDSVQFDTLEPIENIYEQDETESGVMFENLVDDDTFDNMIAEESDDFQFANFDEIENTAFGTFFETNSEIASNDELDDEFDEPLQNGDINAPSLALEEDLSGENREQENIEGDGASSTEYVSLIDFLAQSADDDQNNQVEDETAQSSEDILSVDETASDDAASNLDEQPECEAIDEEPSKSEEIISENEMPGSAGVADEAIVEDDSAEKIEENNSVDELDEQLETVDIEDNWNDEANELSAEENLETYALSSDEEMLLGEDVNNEDNQEQTDDESFVEDEIYTLADDEKADDLYNPDDEIYDPIPEDEQIYVPLTDDEETSADLVASNEMASSDELQDGDDEKTDDDSLYLFNDEVNDSSDKTDEVVTPTYINFGTHTYEEADITKNHEDIEDLYNLDDSAQNDISEFDNAYNLADNDANDELDSVESEPMYEEPKPIYRASQEEIESLYKTTENYENLQAGYTDETYKQMLNELENYGNTAEEETIQRPAAKTLDELSASFEKEGIEIRKYEKQQKESDDTKIYIKTHQIHMVKNWITFSITTFALIVTFLIMNAFKENFTYPFSFAQFAIAIGVGALFPLYSTILYLANPYKKVVAKYAPRLSILLSIMINIQLILIIYCLNLQLGFYSFAQENYNHLMWILPLILSFIPTIQALVYYPLFSSKNYHT